MLSIFDPAAAKYFSRCRRLDVKQKLERLAHLTQPTNTVTHLLMAGSGPRIHGEIRSDKSGPKLQFSDQRVQAQSHD